MGISGLTKYISDRSYLYMKSYELHDCHLVVDGNNIYVRLYKEQTEFNGIFGGDYDEYYEVVRNFFRNLQKCNVTPIVLCDGGHETKKIKTVLERAEGKLECTKNFHHITTIKFSPIFVKEVFIDVMEELNVNVVQCDLEADEEIATVAKTLNCPVLSYDSDFYIYDVLYIPFDSIQVEPVSVELPNKKWRHYIQCSVFDSNTFLREFDGLGKSLLPILTTVLGNDYTDPFVFETFFNNICTKTKMRKSRQAIIHGFLKWLKLKNFDAAVKGILRNLKYEEGNKFMQALNFNLLNYSEGLISQSVYSATEKLVQDKTYFTQVEQKKPSYTVPLPIQILLQKGKISSFILDLINLRTYFTLVVFEDFSQTSCHLLCLDIIKAIFALLNQYTIKSLNKFKIYVRVKNNYSPLQLDNTTFDIDLHKGIYNEPSHVRLNLIYNILKFKLGDVEKLSAFISSWSLFLMALIYWMKSLKKTESICEVHAILLMLVANQVVQNRVGYNETCSLLGEKSKDFFKRQNKFSTKVENGEDGGNAKEFENMLINVTKVECLMVQKALKPLRHAKNKEFFLPAIHSFNSFQSCLYHIYQLNALLNYPLPHMKVHKFYSDKLLYNLYINVKKKKVQCESFGQEILKVAPNVQKIYFYLYEKLITNTEFNNKLIMETKKVKKRRRKKRLAKHDDQVDDSDSNCIKNVIEEKEEFTNIENSFYLLAVDKNT